VGGDSGGRCSLVIGLWSVYGHLGHGVAAIRAIDIRSMTTLFNAHITACVESFALGAAAAVVS